MVRVVAVKNRRKHRKKGKISPKVIIMAVFFLMLLFCFLLEAFKEGNIFQKSNFFREIHKEKEEKSILQRKKREEEKIRVLITNSNMSSIFHDVVQITGSEEFSVKRNGKKEVYSPGEIIEFTKEEIDKNSEKVLFACPKGKIKILSVLRRQEIPAYRGIIEIKKESQGLLVINELKLREYLYGVVPGEMSASYPMEALKAQAVCARSFAWNQKKANRYKEYDAHVDDTTAFQVYNMAGEDKRTQKAVDDTAGELLYHGKKVITTYYYSTSWGSSATTKEVWGGDANVCYPAKLQITKSSQKKTGIKGLNFSEEKIFREFITNEICNTYDEESNWYRWRTELPAKQLGLKLGIGTIKKIQILERGKSGLLQKIRITGSKGSEVIEGQQSIREKLLLSDTVIETKDGNRQSLSLLPSAAFFVQDSVSNGEVQFRLIGGGFGHGVGMSQNGAAAMAKEGFSYQDILSHYYQECQIK